MNEFIQRIYNAIRLKDSSGAIINPATSDNQTNGNQKTKIVDAAGNVIHASADADGNYHLSTAVIQEIIASTNNSTTTNLASGATFTGIADETFGINGIQVYHASDKDCTLYIDQSIDDSFTDSTQTFTNTFTCLANSPCSRTFASVAPYYRLRVTNTDLTAGTTTKLSSFTGMTPVISTLPVELSTKGNLQVVASLRGNENYDRHVWVSPTNTLGINNTVRLVGTNFDGTTQDPNFWTAATANGGTVAQNGEIQLNTSTDAAGSASYTSVSKARFVVGSANKFQGIFKFVTAGTASNTRRCGAYLATDGFFFELAGTTFSIGTRISSSDTLVSSGSFNGNIGPNFTPLTTQYYKLEIEYTPKGVFYYVDGVLLHKIGSGYLSGLLTLPIVFENINAGSTTDVVFDCLGVVIIRLGELKTNSTYKYIAGAATTILKYGAGDLHTIVNNDNSGTLIAYDNTAGSGTIIASIDLVKVLGPIIFDAPFSDGLTIVTTGASAKITVIYE